MIELVNVPQGCVRIWEVWINSDSIEGRGPMQLHARFLKHEDALAEARGKGPMGASDGDVRQAIVFDTRQTYLKERDEEIRHNVLKRLTPDERRVLGL